MSRVRVLSWNLWWRFGDWSRRGQAIADILGQERPDLCGLQEVWVERGGRSQVTELAERLVMHWALAPREDAAHWQSRTDLPGVDVGIAVLSRWPIADTAVAPLGDVGPAQGAHLLVAETATPQGPLYFATTT